MIPSASFAVEENLSLRTGSLRELSDFKDDKVREKEDLIKRGTLHSTLSPSRHLDLLKRWLPLLAKESINTLTSIYVGRVLSHSSLEEMSLMQLTLPSLGLASAIGTGFLDPFEDFVAKLRKKYEQSEEGGDLLEKDQYAAEMGATLRVGALLSILASIPSVGFFWFLKPTRSSLSTSTNSSNQEDFFYKIFSLCIPLNYVCTIMDSFSVSSGNMRISLLMGLANLGVCFWFLDGPFKSSNIMNGMGLINLTGSFVNLFGYVSSYYINKEFQHYRIFVGSIDTFVFSNMIKASIPFILRRLLLSAPFFLYTRFILPNQPEVLSVTLLLSQITMPISIVSGIIGRALNISTKNTSDNEISEDSFKAGLVGLFQTASWASSYSLFSYCLSDYIMRFYADQHKTEDLSFLSVYNSLLLLEVFNQFFTAIGTVTSSLLRGMNKMEKVVQSETLTYWAVTLPISYVLSQYYGATGAFWGSLVGSIFNTTFLCLTWCSQFKRHNSHTQV